jgi:uncharacterized protein YbbC (DUF1343 family)
MMREIKTFMRIALVAISILIGNSEMRCQMLTGAQRPDAYFSMLTGKNLALVVNQTSVTGKMHLVDTLLKVKMKVKKILAPEHGFRGDHEAGAKIKNTTDKKTGLPVISLYGDHKKPTADDLKDIDIVVFDIQDVGCRFYTYISTLHYVMEACAEQHKRLLVLDRPNPNAHYIDGPVLDMKFSSFVGMHPVPVVYGMTIGEYAKMINGEGWLKDSMKCDLSVVPCYGYDHDQHYIPPIPPSPNLQTIESIYLYPSLCFFEGTDVSVGRGTSKPFELIGKPNFPAGNTTFKPISKKGIADNPLYQDTECKGFELTKFCHGFIMNSNRIYLYWLEGFYQQSDTTKFFNSFFDKLAGTDLLRMQIQQHIPVKDIMKSWEPALQKFAATREKYLLYTD